MARDHALYRAFAGHKLYRITSSHESNFAAAPRSGSWLTLRMI